MPEQFMWIISYYGLRESLYLASQALIKEGKYHIHDVPLMKWGQDCTEQQIISRWSRHLAKYPPRYILWWYIGLSPQLFKQLVQLAPTDTKILYFNWDEPHNWSSQQLAEKAPYIDQAWVCCQETIKRWIQAGSQAHYLLPGCAPTLHRPLPLPKRYDISFVLTNLYQDPAIYPHQVINRRQLLDTLYQHQDNPRRPYRLALFGPPELKETYPDSYISYLSYYDLPKVASQTIVNLNQHVCGQFQGYFNERTVLLLACGALMWCDPVKGSQELLGPHGHTCLYIDVDRPLDQLLDLLSTYDRDPHCYQAIQHRARQWGLQHTWSCWARQIRQRLNSLS